MELTELLRLLFEADVCRDELLDLFEIAVVRLLAGGATAAVVEDVDEDMKDDGSWVAVEIDVFGGAILPTYTQLC